MPAGSGSGSAPASELEQSGIIADGRVERAEKIGCCKVEGER